MKAEIPRILLLELEKLARLILGKDVGDSEAIAGMRNQGASSEHSQNSLRTSY